MSASQNGTYDFFCKPSQKSIHEDVLDPLRQASVVLLSGPGLELLSKHLCF